MIRDHHLPRALSLCALLACPAPAWANDRADARTTSASLVTVAEGSPRVVIARGGWSKISFPSFEATIAVRTVRPTRLGYAVTFVARNQEACVGAIQGARYGAISVELDGIIYKEEVFEPYRWKSGRVDPAEGACGQLEYPAAIRIHRSVDFR